MKNTPDTYFDQNRKLFIFNNSEEWANLYSAWNAGFMLQFAQSPYQVVKLLIPSVNAFHHEPGLYIHNRAVALYLHMNYIMYRRARDSSFSGNGICMKRILGEIGTVNKESAQSGHFI